MVEIVGMIMAGGRFRDFGCKEVGISLKVLPVAVYGDMSLIDG